MQIAHVYLGVGDKNSGLSDGTDLSIYLVHKGSVLLGNQSNSLQKDMLFDIFTTKPSMSSICYL